MNGQQPPEGQLPIHKFYEAGERAFLRVREEMSAEERAQADRQGIRFGVGVELEARFNWYDPARFGEMSPERDLACTYYCTEKAFRLHQHPEHESSGESANPEAKQFDGAVRWGRYVISTSGLSAVQDKQVGHYTVEELKTLDPMASATR